MPLEFQINLGGNFVEALEKTSSGLTTVEKATKSFGDALERTEAQLHAIKADPAKFKKLAEAQRELAKLSKELGGEEESLKEKLEQLTSIEIGGFGFNLAEGMAQAFEHGLELLKEMAEEAYELGKEIAKAAGDAEDLNLAIKLDVGDEGSEKVGELAESFMGTRFSPKLIKESLLPILEESGDAHNEQWDDLVTAATDVATRRKTGSAGARSALDALRSIEIQPQKIRGALKELGIKQVDFYSDLGDLLGISSASAEKQVKAGKVKADTLLNIALHQIAEREGGALGNATNEGSKTLGTALERLANLKDNLFERLAGSRGMEALQGFLDNFITTMEGPIGTDLVNKIDTAFTELFGDLSGPDGLERMKDVLSSAVQLVGEMIDSAKQLADALAPSLETVQDLVIGLRQFVALSSGDKQGFQAAVQEEMDVRAKRLVRGYQRMNELQAKFAAENTPEMVTALPQGPDQFGWADIPKMADGGIVSSPTFALIGEAGPEAVIPLRGGRGGVGGGSSISIGDVVVHAGDTKDAYELGQLVRIELKKLLDEAAANFGEAA